MSNSTKMRHNLVWKHGLLAAVLAAAVTAGAMAIAKPTDEDVRAFERMLEQVQRDIRAARESDMIDLMRLGQKVGRAYPASLAARQFLSQHVEQSPQVLLVAAQTAEAAGDMRAAAARYRNYLKIADPGREASDAAAAFYQLMLDFLHVGEDAYRFMSETAGRYRGTEAARKYDAWYLASARAQKDYANHARWLRVVLKDRMPLVEEQLHYWADLDWLLNAMTTAGKDQREAVGDFSALATMIRNDAVRTQRAAFLLENLNFHMRGMAGDAEARRRNFDAVKQAAMNYFDSRPDTSTLKDIYITFGGGYADFKHERCREDWDGKGEVLLYAFPKLSEAERIAFLKWRHADKPMVHSMAPPAQWSALGRSLADWFRGNLRLNDLAFGERYTDRAQYKADAAFLAGVPSTSAALINAVAAGETPQQAVDHLFAKENWHLDFGDFVELIDRGILPAYRALQEAGPAAAAEGEEAAAAPATDWEAVRDALLAYTFNKYASRSPVAIFDTDGMRECLESAWRYHTSPGRNVTDMIPLLMALDWAPYPARVRRDVFQPVNLAFRKWAEDARRESDKNKDQKLFQLIATIEDAMRGAMNLAAPRFDMAPDDLSRKIAEARYAAQQNNGNMYAARIQELFGTVKGFTDTKVPYGRATMKFVASQQEWDEVYNAQLGMAETLLTPWADGAINMEASTFIDQFMRSRGWGWGNVDRRERTRVLRLNDTLTKVLGTALDAGRFSSTIFDWYRATRRGRNWGDDRHNTEIMRRMIEEKTLVKYDYAGPLKNNAVAYMNIVANEFRELRGRYPASRFFDAMFVEEARAKNHLDAGYWRGGADERGMVAAVAAEILQGYTTLPLGYGNTRAMYTPSELDAWFSRAMGAEAAKRDAMIKAAEDAYGSTRFDSWAMGKPYFRFQAKTDTPEDRKAFFDKLKTYIDRAGRSRAREDVPSMTALGGLAKSGNVTAAELQTLLSLFDNCVPHVWRKNLHMDLLVRTVEKAADDLDEPERLMPYARYFWKICRDTDNGELQRALVNRTQLLVDKRLHHIAAAYALTGSDILQAKLTEGNRTLLMALKSKALATVANEVPFDKNDPRYPMFMAQVAYMTGREEESWSRYMANRLNVLTSFKSLDPNYSIWIIRRHTDLKQFDMAEDLARPMILWMDENPRAFDPEVRGSLYVSYAGIAFGREEFPQARAQYERIANLTDFAGTLAQRRAELMIAEVDRQTGNFDEAAERLEKLARRRDEYTHKEANYLLARVKYDQEEYADAMDCLNNVFSVDAVHPDARILEGKVLLKLKKLMEATDVKVGHLASQRFLVPGKPLRIGLEDPSLAVVGKAMDVEIEVKTKSGDRELFRLLPFGDSMTKFDGSISTELAPLAREDGKLQLLGDDVITFDFSPEFKKQNRLPDAESGEIIVMSDAEMYASSGKIISREEREKAAMEQLIRARLEMEQEVEEKGPVVLSTLRAGNQIKPGNKINVRIVDLDRSITADADEITLQVTGSSGDRINAFVLKETETHSGVFEGQIPTDSAEAAAYASDSDEGRDPNYAITAGDYPAWVAMPDSRRPKTYTVDVYDNVMPAKLKLVSDVPGRRIKELLLLTSLNGRTYEAVGSYPAVFRPWDGSPRLTLARFVSGTGAEARSSGLGVVAPERLKAYLDSGFMIQGEKRIYDRHQDFSLSWNDDVGGHVNTLGLTASGEGSYYAGHMSGGFYIDKRQIRTFELQGSGDGLAYSLYIDGVAATAVMDEGAAAGASVPAPVRGYRIKQVFKKGVHRVDVYFLAQRQTKPKLQLLMDCAEPPYMKPCPADMFDAIKLPQLTEVLSTKPATVNLSEDGKTFDFDFSDTMLRARVFKMLILDYETDAPAISRVELVDREGRQILPTKNDLLALRGNATLEIVPGDTITVSYRDPKYITPKMEMLQERLLATFNNGTVSASFLEVGYGRNEQREETYIPLRRYDVGDDLVVFVRDPDGDVSDEMDALPFEVRTSRVGAKPVVLKAMETEPHSGVFTMRIFPVEGEAARDSEIMVEEGDDIIIRYMDKENTDPGIPWERSFVCEQVWYQDPEVRVYDVQSMPLPPPEAAAAAEGEGAAAAKPAEKAVRKPTERTADRRAVLAGEERFVPTRSLVAIRPQSAGGETNATALIDSSIIVELLWPTIAKSPRSTATIFAQTTAGRAKKEAAGDVVVTEEDGRPFFDVTVPGTVTLASGPSADPSVRNQGTYASAEVVGEQRAGSALDDGIFTFNIAMELGEAGEKEQEETIRDRDRGRRRRRSASGSKPLRVQGSDQVFVGFRYVDDIGMTNWIVRTVDLSADIFFDVMDRHFLEPVQARYVGETVYFRVVDKLKDSSAEKDRVKIKVTTGSGAAQEAELVETMSHSGIFKGYARFMHAEEASDPDPNTLFVRYGDVVRMTYGAPEREQEVSHEVRIYKGADGLVQSFTRRFEDADTAVQTQFTLAEAYFEIAKDHRKLKEMDLALEKIALGKKVLEEALRDFPDTENRAQAEYLLANLAFEMAKDAGTPEEERATLLESANRFAEIVVRYPDSPYAPKSQYKKGVVYEMMGEVKKASDEYVKLAYRYPDHELVADTIARLGQFFLVEGKKIETRSRGIEDVIEKETVRMEALEKYKIAGDVFGRLLPKFPQHTLAGRTGVLSGQCYIRAELYEEAAKALERVVDRADTLEPKLVAEAMFWCAESYLKLGTQTGSTSPMIEAYKMYTRLRWDYPDTDWAKHARGRLAGPEMAAASATLAER